MSNRITYFAVLPFTRTQDGDFLAEAAIEARSADQTRAIASRMGKDRSSVPVKRNPVPAN
jgi:hypothetical protein